MDSIYSVWSIMIGLIIGSFLNVCIYRIPLGESINYPPSNCQHCHKRIKPIDLIPVISYVLLKGRCRNCKSSISLQYPLIEIINGMAYGWIYMRYGLALETFMMWGMISIMITLAIIDLRHFLLPTEIIAFGSLWIVCFNGIRSYYAQDISLLGMSLLGGVVGYSLGYICYWYALKVIKKQGFGYGDVRYLGMLGLVALPLEIAAILSFSAILGLVYGSILYFKNNQQSKHFALGPWLSLAFVISSLNDYQIYSWYLW